MKHILSRANVELLAQLARSRVLLAFDFDGTLAPIVSTRQSASMRAKTQTLFEQVCEQYPCAVISGRSRKDVRERLFNARVKYVVGNHGLEPLYVGDDITDEDVFELDPPGRLLSIRVGQTRRSAAAYYLRDQREIDRLLAKLHQLRASLGP
jgi:trehalose-6-phosphatase